MAFLKLKDLRKSYQKDVRVVKDINLDIEKGEFVVFLGPSGCGKTTTLRMIAGLEDVTSGDILLDGKSIKNLQPGAREFSMIFQSYAVWPHMSVYNNIAYPLKLRKMSKKEIDKIVKECAEICNLSEYLDRYPSQLSGGQRQRIAVARAIAVKPKVFLMDEPLSNLDAKLRVSVRTFLKEVHLANGATTIFVTHDQSEAMALADKVVVMNMGVIEQIGTPMEVYSDCESVFVANFLGTPPTNFLDVSVQEKEDEYVIKNNEFSFNIKKDKFKSLNKYVGKNITMGIRPENVNITEDEGLLTVDVNVVEPQGAYTILVTKVNNKEFKIIYNANYKFSLGEKIKIGFELSDCMFFDKETEKRIR